MATSAFSESSSRNGYIRSGPSEQLSPTESGFTCCTAFQKASVVCAEISVSPPRPTAAEIVGIGRIGERDGQRPDSPGDEPRKPGFIGDAIGPFAALPRRGLIDLP